MTKRLKQTDRDILGFRPNIAFIEPDQEEGTIEGEDKPAFENLEQDRERIKVC
jgi:hypothetical protein